MARRLSGALRYKIWDPHRCVSVLCYHDSRHKRSKCSATLIRAFPLKLLTSVLSMLCSIESGMFRSTAAAWKADGSGIICTVKNGLDIMFFDKTLAVKETFAFPPAGDAEDTHGKARFFKLQVRIRSTMPEVRRLQCACLVSFCEQTVVGSSELCEVRIARLLTCTTLSTAVLGVMHISEGTFAAATENRVGVFVKQVCGRGHKRASADIVVSH